MNRAAGARAGKSPLGWIARVASGLAMAVALLQPAQPAAAREGPPVLLDGMGTIAEQRLPNEARVTLQRIESGGPFPYAKDGTRFGNYERLLPRKPRGYYREYTVAKPNSRSRGPKRIVCGGPQRMVDDCYYTEDHYNSFKRITR
ncbi:ribonuclease domain-containing protein [Cupriavidus sp. AU9028]|uniref:ribonuclease domain-containing protein n=1 Tax=Cupriavidus sp. AU9028 TaxID=2871157 RepID=UPI001C94A262|nr:ribonuclease domain-containing protein [Cupriavidus sp. AU9028]MBY4897382.1 ribonuclease [Cupriavidus sp. AU9028]